MAGIAVFKDSTRLYISDGAEELKLADKMTNLVSIGEIGADTEEIDTTCIDSEAKESVGGFADYGTFSVEQNITESEYTRLSTLQKAGTPIKWAVFADNKSKETVFKLGGNGYVKTCKWSGASVGDLLKVSAEIKISGEPTETVTEPVALVSLAEVEPEK